MLNWTTFVALKSVEASGDVGWVALGVPNHQNTSKKFPFCPALTIKNSQRFILPAHETKPNASRKCRSVLTLKLKLLNKVWVLKITNFTLFFLPNGINLWIYKRQTDKGLQPHFISIMFYTLFRRTVSYVVEGFYIDFCHFWRDLPYAVLFSFYASICTSD